MQIKHFNGNHEIGNYIQKHDKYKFKNLNYLSTNLAGGVGGKPGKAKQVASKVGSAVGGAIATSAKSIGGVALKAGKVLTTGKVATSDAAFNKRKRDYLTGSPTLGTVAKIADTALTVVPGARLITRGLSTAVYQATTAGKIDTASTKLEKNKANLQAATEAVAKQEVELNKSYTKLEEAKKQLAAATDPEEKKQLAEEVKRLKQDYSTQKTVYNKMSDIKRVADAGVYRRSQQLARLSQSSKDSRQMSNLAEVSSLGNQLKYPGTDLHNRVYGVDTEALKTANPNDPSVMGLKQDYINIIQQTMPKWSARMTKSKYGNKFNIQNLEAHQLQKILMDMGKHDDPALMYNAFATSITGQVAEKPAADIASAVSADVGAEMPPKIVTGPPMPTPKGKKKGKKSRTLSEQVEEKKEEIKNEGIDKLDALIKSSESETAKLEDRLKQIEALGAATGGSTTKTPVEDFETLKSELAKDNLEIKNGKIINPAEEAAAAKAAEAAKTTATGGSATASVAGSTITTGGTTISVSLDSKSIPIVTTIAPTTTTVAGGTTVTSGGSTTTSTSTTTAKLSAIDAAKLGEYQKQLDHIAAFFKSKGFTTPKTQAELAEEKKKIEEQKTDITTRRTALSTLKSDLDTSQTKVKQLTKPRDEFIKEIINKPNADWPDKADILQKIANTETAKDNINTEIKAKEAQIANAKKELDDKSTYRKLEEQEKFETEKKQAIKTLESALEIDRLQLQANEGFIKRLDAELKEKTELQNQIVKTQAIKEDVDKSLAAMLTGKTESEIRELTEKAYEMALGKKDPESGEYLFNQKTTQPDGSKGITIEQGLGGNVFPLIKSGQFALEVEKAVLEGKKNKFTQISEEQKNIYGNMRQLNQIEEGKYNTGITDFIKQNEQVFSDPIARELLVEKLKDKINTSTQGTDITRLPESGLYMSIGNNISSPKTNIPVTEIDKIVNTFLPDSTSQSIDELKNKVEIIGQLNKIISEKEKTQALTNYITAEKQFKESITLPKRLAELDRTLAVIKSAEPIKPNNATAATASTQSKSYKQELRNKVKQAKAELARINREITGSRFSRAKTMSPADIARIQDLKTQEIAILESMDAIQQNLVNQSKSGLFRDRKAKAAESQVKRMVKRISALETKKALLPADDTATRALIDEEIKKVNKEMNTLAANQNTANLYQKAIKKVESSRKVRGNNAVEGRLRRTLKREISEGTSALRSGIANESMGQKLSNMTARQSQLEAVRKQAYGDEYTEDRSRFRRLLGKSSVSKADKTARYTSAIDQLKAQRGIGDTVKQALFNDATRQLLDDKQKAFVDKLDFSTIEAARKSYKKLEDASKESSNQTVYDSALTALKKQIPSVTKPVTDSLSKFQQLKESGITDIEKAITELKKTPGDEAKTDAIKTEIELLKNQISDQKPIFDAISAVTSKNPLLNTLDRKESVGIYKDLISKNKAVIKKLNKLEVPPELRGEVAAIREQLAKQSEALITRAREVNRISSALNRGDMQKLESTLDQKQAKIDALKDLYTTKTPIDKKQINSEIKLSQSTNANKADIRNMLQNPDYTKAFKLAMVKYSKQLQKDVVNTEIKQMITGLGEIPERETGTTTPGQLPKTVEDATNMHTALLKYANSITKALPKAEKKQLKAVYKKQVIAGNINPTQLSAFYEKIGEGNKKDKFAAVVSSLAELSSDKTKPDKISSLLKTASASNNKDLQAYLANPVGSEQVKLIKKNLTTYMSKNDITGKELENVKKLFFPEASPSFMTTLKANMGFTSSIRQAAQARKDEATVKTEKANTAFNGFAKELFGARIDSILDKQKQSFTPETKPTKSVSEEIREFVKNHKKLLLDEKFNESSTTTAGTTDYQNKIKGLNEVASEAAYDVGFNTLKDIKIAVRLANPSVGNVTKPQKPVKPAFYKLGRTKQDKEKANEIYQAEMKTYRDNKKAYDTEIANVEDKVRSDMLADYLSKPAESEESLDLKEIKKAFMGNLAVSDINRVVKQLRVKQIYNTSDLENKINVLTEAMKGSPGDFTRAEFETLVKVPEYFKVPDNRNFTTINKELADFDSAQNKAVIDKAIALTQKGKPEKAVKALTNSILKKNTPEEQIALLRNKNIEMPLLVPLADKLLTNPKVNDPTVIRRLLEITEKPATDIDVFKHMSEKVDEFKVPRLQGKSETKKAISDYQTKMEEIMYSKKFAEKLLDNQRKGVEPRIKANMERIDELSKEIDKTNANIKDLQATVAATDPNALYSNVEPEIKLRDEQKKLADLNKDLDKLNTEQNKLIAKEQTINLSEDPILLNAVVKQAKTKFPTNLAQQLDDQSFTKLVDGMFDGSVFKGTGEVELRKKPDFDANRIRQAFGISSQSLSQDVEKVKNRILANLNSEGMKNLDWTEYAMVFENKQIDEKLLKEQSPEVLKVISETSTVNKSDQLKNIFDIAKLEGVDNIKDSLLQFALLKYNPGYNKEIKPDIDINNLENYMNIIRELPKKYATNHKLNETSKSNDTIYQNLLKTVDSLNTIYNPIIEKKNKTNAVTIDSPVDSKKEEPTYVIMSPPTGSQAAIKKQENEQPNTPIIYETFLELLPNQGQEPTKSESEQPKQPVSMSSPVNQPQQSLATTNPASMQQPPPPPYTGKPPLPNVDPSMKSSPQQPAQQPKPNTESGQPSKPSNIIDKSLSVLTKNQDLQKALEDSRKEAEKLKNSLKSNNIKEEEKKRLTGILAEKISIPYDKITKTLGELKKLDLSEDETKQIQTILSTVENTLNLTDETKKRKLFGSATKEDTETRQAYQILDAQSNALQEIITKKTEAQKEAEEKARQEEADAKSAQNTAVSDMTVKLISNILKKTDSQPISEVLEGMEKQQSGNQLPQVITANKAALIGLYDALKSSKTITQDQINQLKANPEITPLLNAVIYQNLAKDIEALEANPNQDSKDKLRTKYRNLLKLLVDDDKSKVPDKLNEILADTSMDLKSSPNNNNPTPKPSELQTEIIKLIGTSKGTKAEQSRIGELPSRQGGGSVSSHVIRKIPRRVRKRSMHIDLSSFTGNKPSRKEYQVRYRNKGTRRPARRPARRTAKLLL